ncbi:MAG TPA: glycosyltransferase family 25 protein [Rhabdochlamydiaceae bacterium]|nr:glycosyltransferase family 25 protein [Rhabdochlamydiaceae bacterium]
MHGLNYFDGTLYINLAHRKDRRVKIEAELQKVSLNPNKLFRIEALYDELNGARGCVLSHSKALDHAIEKEWKHVLILEDDCLFQKNKIHSYIENFLTYFKQEWDVFFLGGQLQVFEKTDHPDYLKVQFSLRAHAYAVNGSYLRVLRDHFLATYESMRDDLFFVHCLHKALDRQWVDLQLKDRWFMGIKPIARQSSSYSDIEKSSKPKR